MSPRAPVALDLAAPAPPVPPILGHAGCWAPRLVVLPQTLLNTPLVQIATALVSEQEAGLDGVGAGPGAEAGALINIPVAYKAY